MSANKEKMGALVDLLTAVFIVVMLVVVAASRNGNRQDRGNRDGQAKVCEQED